MILASLASVATVALALGTGVAGLMAARARRGLAVRGVAVRDALAGLV